MLATIGMYSQSFEWLVTPTTSLGLNPDMVGYSVTCDQENNVYFLGYKSDPFPYNSIMGNLHLNKYNNNGELIFSKVIEGKTASHNMITDSQGNLILALSYVETFTFDDLTLTASNVGENWVMLKLDTEGTLLYHQEIYMEFENAPGLNAISDFIAFATDNSDNIYLGYGTFMDSYISKYSADGTLLFTIEQLNVARVTSLSVDEDGNIYAAGSCADPGSQFAGTAIDTDMEYNTYLVKYSQEGAYQWVKFVEDITCIEPKVVVYSSEEIYFSSVLPEPYLFDTIQTDGGSGFFSDFFLAKLNSAGAYQWVREVPGAGSISTGNRNFLNIDATGNVYFAGRTAGLIQWSEDITTETDNFGGDAVLLKYSAEGDIVFAKTAGGASNDRFDGVAVNAMGDIFVCGMSIGEATFDAIVHEGSDSDYYPFLAKIGSEQLHKNQNDLSIAVLYPNPASNYITLSNSDYSKASIVNVLGQTIRTIAVQDNTQIYVADLAAGTYFIKANGFKPLKFIKK